MKTIKELLDIVITLEDNPQTSKVIDFHKGVPTLESGVYRKASPMLKVRYELFGKWLNATHGDWLDTEEMESFWSEGADDERLAGIVRNAPTCAPCAAVCAWTCGSCGKSPAASSAPASPPGAWGWSPSTCPASPIWPRTSPTSTSGWTS